KLGEKIGEKKLVSDTIFRPLAIPMPNASPEKWCLTPIFFPQFFSAMPPLEFSDDVLEPQPPHAQQHDDVIEQVGGLGRDAGVVLRGRGERKLDAFFADLLRDLHDPLLREARGVALLR